MLPSLNWRHFVGWTQGFTLSSGMYGVLLAAMSVPDGQDNLYIWVILIGAVLTLVAWILSATAERDKYEREPAIAKGLKDFYGRSHALLTRQVSSDAELDELRVAVGVWYAELRAWADVSLEPASVARLRESRMALPYRHAKPFNDQPQMLLNGLSVVHENVRGLIESRVWK